MTTRAVSPTFYPQNQAGVVIYEWTGLLNGDDGSPIELPSFPDMSVEFSGTFGTGGTILLEGSNKGSAYYTLTDPQGNAISKTAAALEQVEELVRYVRPRVSAGDGTTSLTATLICRRTR